MKEETKIYLGVDWGGARIGLATGNSETRIASPWKTVSTLDEVISAAREEMSDVVIVGAPYQKAGQDIALNPAFNSFVGKLREGLDVPVELYDERMSSKAADALSGDKKTKASRDELAAMIILQDYIDNRWKKHTA